MLEQKGEFKRGAIFTMFAECYVSGPSLGILIYTYTKHTHIYIYIYICIYEHIPIYMYMYIYTCWFDSGTPTDHSWPYS